MLWKRVLSAIVGIPILIFTVYYGGIPFFLSVALLVFLGLQEFYQFIKNKGINLPKVIFITNGMIFICLSFFNIHGGPVFDCFLLYILISIFLTQIFYNEQKNALTNTSVTFLGIVYIGWLATHLIYLRNMNDGFFYLILVLLVTWANDTGAYFVGINLGKHKLCPKISPNKTIEGAIGGLISSLLAIFLIGWWINKILPNFTFILPHLIGLGFIISLAAQFGDLVESLFKRDAGIKDSSNLIPGHGGILDRFDSLLFTVPVVYYYLQILM